MSDHDEPCNCEQSLALEAELRELQNVLRLEDELQQHNSYLREHVKVMQAAYCALETENAVLHTRVETLEAENAALEDRVRELEVRLPQYVTKAQSEARVEQATADLNASLKHQGRTLLAVRAENATLKALVAELESLESLVPLMQARIDAMSVFDDQDDEEIRENLEAWKESGASAERAAIVADIKAVSKDWRDIGGSEGRLKSYGCDYLIGRIESLAHHHAEGSDE